MTSVIIPTYNSLSYLSITLDSILSQKGVEFEVLVIDDGSTDNTLSFLTSIRDDRLTFFSQANSGVSEARNLGLKNAKGEFIIFFDSDDLMTSNFIKSREEVLIKEQSLDFCCSTVRSFSDDVVLEEKKFSGCSEDMHNNILFYRPNFHTCPSNYMFRHSFLKKHGIRFNPKLSSTADKYFLLEVDKYKGKGTLIYVGELFYRVSKKSMSHKMDIKLIRDNEEFYKQVLENNIIKHNLINMVMLKGYYILARSFLKIGYFREGTLYTLKYFLTKLNLYNL